MGFSMLSVEGGMPEADRLNDFVLKGQGDPAKLIKGLYEFRWDTQEVLDLVLWMREFNKSGMGHVQFTGFDMQTPTLAMEAVRDFLVKTDADYVPAMMRAQQMVLASRNPLAVDRNDVAIEWEKIVSHLDSLRPRPGIDWAVQNARIVVQCMQHAAKQRTPMATAARDASMATNVKWLLDQSPDAKIVLWAHNFHVMTSPDSMGVGLMGTMLRKMYGDKMVALGFAFNRGSFQAYSANGRLQDFTVPPALAGSLDATLAASGIPLFALDFRTAPKSGPVAEWLSAKHPTRNIFAGFYEDLPGSNMFDQVMTETYDGLLFVEKTSAVRPNKP